MTTLQWILSWDELLSLPPSLKTRAWPEEWADRRTGTEAISKLGHSLGLPQVVIATAQVFFHRFYLRESFKQYNSHDIVMACTFLAAKVEETPRKLRDIIHAHQAIRFKNATEIMDRFAEGTREYKELYDRLLALEKQILVVNCFDLTIDHPYRHLARLFKDEFNENVMKEMWNVLNDSYLLPLCLLFQPRVLALALLMGKLSFTSGDELLTAHLPSSKSWHEVFPKTSKEEVEAAVQFIFHSPEHSQYLGNKL